MNEIENECDCRICNIPVLILYSEKYFVLRVGCIYDVVYGEIYLCAGEDKICPIKEIFHFSQMISLAGPQPKFLSWKILTIVSELL